MDFAIQTDQSESKKQKGRQILGFCQRDKEAIEYDSGSKLELVGTF